jgi:hypothetical protein
MLAENQSWQELYMRTILEVNATKMPERVAATRQAIAARLRDLEHDSDHHVERRKMQGGTRCVSLRLRHTHRWAMAFIGPSPVSAPHITVSKWTNTKRAATRAPGLGDPSFRVLAL